MAWLDVACGPVLALCLRVSTVPYEDDMLPQNACLSLLSCQVPQGSAEAYNTAPEVTRQCSVCESILLGDILLHLLTTNPPELLSDSVPQLRTVCISRANA